MFGDVLQKALLVGETLVTAVTFEGLVRLMAPRVRLQVTQLAERLLTSLVFTLKQGGYFLRFDGFFRARNPFSRGFSRFSGVRPNFSVFEPFFKPVPRSGDSERSFLSATPFPGVQPSGREPRYLYFHLIFGPKLFLDGKPKREPAPPFPTWGPPFWSQYPALGMRNPPWWTSCVDPFLPRPDPSAKMDVR